MPVEQLPIENVVDRCDVFRGAKNRERDPGSSRGACLALVRRFVLLRCEVFRVDRNYLQTFRPPSRVMFLRVRLARLRHTSDLAAEKFSRIDFPRFEESDCVFPD